MAVKFVNGSLIENVFSYDVILVGMGIYNSFSGGFAYDIKLNFPNVENVANKKFPYGDRRKYGTILSIEYENVTLCLCYFHNGGFKKDSNGVFVDYDYFRECIKKAEERFRGKKIAAAGIGTSKFDGNGSPDKINEILRDIFSETDIYLYPPVNETFDDVMYKKLVELKRKRREEKMPYDEYLKAKNEIYWKRKHGIFEKMPENYEHKKAGFSWDKVINVSKEDLEK